MTKKRQRIYDYIKDTSTPMTAAGIHRELSDAMDLATVYRGLEFLAENRLIQSFLFECDERGIERYYISGTVEHKHYMHCRKCHSFIPLPGCPLKNGTDSGKEIDGFLVEEHNITLKGLCRDCR